MRFLVLVLASLAPQRGETSVFSSSEQGTRGPAILRMPAGVRARGLGGSYVAVADDAGAPQWNPAGLQRVRTKEIQFMRAELFADQNQQFLGYAHPVWRNRDRETWAINANLLDVDSFDVREEGADVGSAQPRELAAGISYARSFWNQAWGVTGKFVEVQTYGQRGQAYAFDLGAMGSWPSPKWTWGVALSNVGTPLKIGEQTISLPTVARAGTVWTKGIGPGDLLATAQGDFPVGGKISGRAGLEYGVPFHSDWRGALRAGVQTTGSEQFSVGFGVHRRSLGINYTFTSNGVLGNAGWTDLTFKFGGPLAPEIERAQLIREVEGLMEEGEWNRARETWAQLNTLSPGHAPVRRLGRVLDTQRVESLDPALLLEQGQEAYQKKQFAGAADHFRKLLLVAPDHIEGRKWLAKTEKQMEADRQARLKAEVAIARERERKQLVRQAETLEARQRWTEALRAWGKILDQGDDVPKAQAHLRSCQEKVYGQAEESLAAGDVGKALSLFRVLEERGAYRDAGPRAKKLEREHAQRLAEAAQAKYREGREAYVHGHLEKAHRLFEEALRLDPKAKEVRQALDQVTEELKLVPVSKP
ncbi:MAG: PorV/PorQ family protein [Elusimicrobia bacterium]|nr:PorV/PorQ family protein [Elusimicrobiota bacterium]